MTNGGECYRRFLDGDAHAFDELMELYHNGLILFINRYVGNYAVAEELAADTFVELLIHKDRFQAKCDFRTYLYSIGRHKAIDYIRKDAKKKKVAPEELSELSEDADLVEEAYIADEEKRKLHAAIGKLAKEYQDVVYLIFFEELSYADAARVLKKGPKQIDNLIYRAKGALRKILTEGE